MRRRGDNNDGGTCHDGRTGDHSGTNHYGSTNHDHHRGPHGAGGER